MMNKYGHIICIEVTVHAVRSQSVIGPMVSIIEFTCWWPLPQEKAQLKVDVFDVDDNQDDKVDFLYGNFTLSAAKSKKLSREQSFRLATAKSM